MKRITLVKAAIDFAYANYSEGAISMATKSLAAFVAAGGQDLDLTIWNNAVSQNVQQAAQLAKQKLPSEILAQLVPTSPGAATEAVSPKVTTANEVPAKSAV